MVLSVGLPSGDPLGVPEGYQKALDGHNNNSYAREAVDKPRRFMAGTACRVGRQPGIQSTLTEDLDTKTPYLSELPLLLRVSLTEARGL